MGWKASTIIIHRPTHVEKEGLLKNLGFDNLKRVADEPFEVAMNPDDNKVYIGAYRNNLLICASDLPMHFLTSSQTETEKTLIKLFPNSEICAIILHSTVNLWGYSITVNGHKVRARAGSADDGTFLEIGVPLEEEKELLAKSRIDGNGKRIYLLEDFPDEPFKEDQVGENFVFSICKRYFGEELDTADQLLFDTRLTGFTYSTGISVNRTSDEAKQAIDESRPWWKFW